MKKSGMMYDEKWGDIVSLWLAEDYNLPKKKRRTSKNYFELLKELGFLGSYRTVCNYVQEWKSIHHHDLPSAGYERLEPPQLKHNLILVPWRLNMKVLLRMLKHWYS